MLEMSSYSILSREGELFPARLTEMNSNKPLIIMILHYGNIAVTRAGLAASRAMRTGLIDYGRLRFGAAPAHSNF